MWTLEALKNDYRIALVAGGRIDLKTLNAYYGTSIDESDCETVELPLPWPLAEVEWGAAIRGGFVQRAMRPHFDRFDILINSYNIGNFGRPGIHFLADFSWDEALRRDLHPVSCGPRGLLQINKPARRAYLGLSRAIAGPGPHSDARAAGMILANSNWSKELLRRRHGIDSRVVYPPVTMRATSVPRERKLRRFVCLGRILPEKRIELVIEILKAVRSRGHDVVLHIIGDTRETAYGGDIEQLCHAEGSWIVLEGRRFGDSKARLLAESAYAIHACNGEAFGIAVAEMITAGCIPFVPEEGGPAEIVERNPALIYKSTQEAVEKIVRVLDDHELEVRLRRCMDERAKTFSQEAFVGKVRGIVAQFVEHMMSSSAPIQSHAL